MRPGQVGPREDPLTATVDGMAEPRRSSAARPILWAVGAAIVAFLIGFGWQFARASRIQTELDQTTQALAESRLEAGLATAFIEAQQGNFERSRQRASSFFTGLQQQVARDGASAPAAFQDILARRDATITMLSRSSPESVATLQQLYTEYRAAAKPADSVVTKPAADSH